MNTEPNNNDRLISLLKQGDEKAYEYLMDRYYRKLCIYANSLTNDSLTAEDIVQNVFIRLWKKRHLLTIRTSLKSFLYRSVHNEYIDQYRKNVALLNVEKRYIEHLNAIIEPEEAQGNEKLIKQVFEAIQNLPPRCKEVFMLSKKNGLTNIEISEYLGISINTVENQIGKAFKILRKSLKNGFYSLFLLYGQGWIKKDCAKNTR
ncbi:RNA polymerase sigma factor [Sinomicrobium weinanense]|uniref:RNA polymerase sigma-70 factor n=1 Tax=Sinomicrobium weinanense TaxID=2842200 RepID=A0A926JR93_9FLAO|nr:RNA polymerase sigma-70 factor [Sinomicrobium weinanense]MBC9795822.1 RNA polymerase sigma-70 factor [Sinomicrobium weinanense]MBU3121866.1 RNA polymerase sigma-70 factor [Sinomicrobium weinanense]